jgi:general secretion pathway protein K
MPSGPSFRPRHASLEETEELLLIRGITPELYYGGYNRDDQGKLVPRAGLNDCLTVYGTGELIDVGAAQPAVLGAIGILPEAVAEIVARRRLMPFIAPEQLAGFTRGAGPGAARLRIGGQSIFTLRATARLRLPNGQLSDLRRTVAATVKYLQLGEPGPPMRILRWYDNSWTE